MKTGSHILDVSLLSFEEVLIKALASAVRYSFVFDFPVATKQRHRLILILIGHVVLELLKMITSSFLVFVRAVVFFLEPIITSVTHRSCFGKQVLLID
jgi:hypothetical protein